jgi:L-threonylcarbamoyladenylate synthase
MTVALDAGDGSLLEDCVRAGGLAVFPTDTVYGLCCDPDDVAAARRMYELKGRPAARSCAVLFFALEPALEALGELPRAERLALQALLPGPVTVLMANRAERFAEACRSDPATLGLRVPRLPDGLAPLSAVELPVMQTSANISGEPDARTLAEVPRSLVDHVDLVLDGGELPGTPSTVIDLRDFEGARRWHVLREGALGREAVDRTLMPLS